MEKAMSNNKSGQKTAPKRSHFARKNKSKSTYTSLMYKSKVKRDEKARKKAEDLATLPKTPVKRFFALFRRDCAFLMKSLCRS